MYPESAKRKPASPGNQFSSFSTPNFGPPVFFLIFVHYLFQRSTGSFDESVAEVLLDRFDVSRGIIGRNRRVSGFLAY